MYEYKLFIIKKDLYKIYENNMESLFLTIKKLSKININEYSYGFSIFNQIFDIFDVKIIKSYFSHKNNKHIKNKKNKFLINDTNLEKSLLTINASNISVKTNSKLPVFFKILNYYNKYIFVVELKNNSFFWLNDQYK